MALLLFNFFQGYHFLHSEIILLSAKLCYAFEEELFFSTKIILWKKIILSCLKTNLCVCVRKFGVRIRTGGGGGVLSIRVGGLSGIP